MCVWGKKIPFIPLWTQVCSGYRPQAPVDFVQRVPPQASGRIQRWALTLSIR